MSMFNVLPFAWCGSLESEVIAQVTTLSFGHGTKLRGGRGSLAVKVSDRGWLVTNSSPVPLKTRHTPNVELVAKSEMGSGISSQIRKWETVNLNDPDQDNGTKILNFCLVILLSQNPEKVVWDSLRHVLILSNRKCGEITDGVQHRHGCYSKRINAISSTFIRESRASAEVDRPSTRPQTSSPVEHGEKVSAAVCKKRHQTIAQIAELAEIFEATCKRIQAKDLNMHNVR
ncbi:hypothetical protein TNCV_1430531 [Trichonephila clavipes]|nr:hypothetical protein TNCV_1430531 [Trichonephila clavipes]